MRYPTMEQVNEATHTDVCRWHRFLPSPADEHQRWILNSIEVKLGNFGGFTPEISKEVGWDEPKDY